MIDQEDEAERVILLTVSANNRVDNAVNIYDDTSSLSLFLYV